MNPNREELLFQLAWTKPDGERASWLDRECADDRALRQRLDALLAAHQQPETLLVTPAEAGRPTIKLDPDEAVGQMFGRYKLLERVGEGGCGVVYVAKQTEPVRRRVALKLIRLGMDTKQVVARFEAERQALAMMDHPSIAKVLDAGMTEASESSAGCQPAVSPTASRPAVSGSGALDSPERAADWQSALRPKPTPSPTLVQMDHPNIAKVLNAGMTEGRSRHTVRAGAPSSDSAAAEDKQP